MALRPTQLRLLQEVRMCCAMAAVLLPRRPRRPRHPSTPARTSPPAPQQIGVGLLQVLAQPGQPVYRRCDHRFPLHVFRQEPRENDAVVLLGWDPRTTQARRTPHPWTLTPRHADGSPFHPAGSMPIGAPSVQHRPHADRSGGPFSGQRSAGFAFSAGPASLTGWTWP
jgi:hypothetical protein